MDKIKVTLMNYTPKEVLIEAMSMPYQTENFKNMSTEDAMRKIKAICVDKKHSSVLEHITFNFKIEGISRLCLQELARHRMASYTVQSTRFTLPDKEEWGKISDACLGLIGQEENAEDIYDKLATKYLVMPNNLEKRERYKYVSQYFTVMLFGIADTVEDRDLKNDTLKYFLPESWRTNLVMSINIRSLRNFLYFRMDKQAHFEIRHLANLMYEQIPSEYKVLFEDLVEKN